jgi:hypothetical protein
VRSRTTEKVRALYQSIPKPVQEKVSPPLAGFTTILLLPAALSLE